MPLIVESYSDNPHENDAAPPIGAPEGMPPSAVNNTMRSMMAATREVWASLKARLDGLGTMSAQSASAVAITGGTMAGDGRGLTIDAAKLEQGTVPAGRLTGTYAISISGTAADATRLGGRTLSDVAVPSGAIVPWWGNSAAVPAGWRLCNGTNGTPDLRGRTVVGVDGGTWQLGSVVGSWSGTTGAAGAHAHGGATHGHALTATQLPPHSHQLFSSVTATTQGVHGAVDPNTSVHRGNQGGMSSSDYMMQFGAGTADAGRSSSVGAGELHTHGIAADGAHTHAVSLVVPSIGLHWIMKI